jgi:hypothetical protein
MAKTMFVKICGPLLAMGLSIGACDDSEVDLDAEGEEVDEGDVFRELCIYNSPPSPDVTATLVGAVTEVDAEDEPTAAACDIYMFRVWAAPAASRARTVGFDAHAFGGFDHIGARLWARTCAGGFCSPYSVIPVPALTQMPGLCNQFVCVPSLVYGEVTLPANNTFTEIRAGMRVLDGDGDVVPVAITVSE